MQMEKKKTPKEHLAVRCSGCDEELGPHLNHTQNTGPEVDKVGEGNLCWPMLINTGGKDIHVPTKYMANATKLGNLCCKFSCQSLFYSRCYGYQNSVRLGH